MRTKSLQRIIMIGIAAAALAGCGAEPGPGVTGTVTEKEYHAFIPGTPAQPASGCQWVTSGNTRFYRCTNPGRPAVPPTPEWWELEITTSSGTEYEIPVDKAVYDSFNIGDVYPHPSGESSS